PTAASQPRFRPLSCCSNPSAEATAAAPTRTSISGTSGGSSMGAFFEAATPGAPPVPRGLVAPRPGASVPYFAVVLTSVLDEGLTPPGAGAVPSPSARGAEPPEPSPPTEPSPERSDGSIAGTPNICVPARGA